MRCDSICEDGRYGRDCNSRCDCNNLSSCNITTGQCICAVGFTGPTCDKPCPKGYYGVNCKQACPPCTSGYGTCHYQTGQCECSPGFTGFFCTTPCPTGTYGRRCMGRCGCKNNGQCYHVSGQCRCPGGWMGEDCSLPCPPGKFGPNCAHDCYCHNGASCNPVDGRCKCRAGYTGNRCEELCPEGYYGQDCYKPCKCTTDNYLCHPTLGCQCQPGYQGPNCTRPTTSSSTFPRPKTQEPHNEAQSGTIFGVIITLALSVVVVFAIVYYRRRIKRLKSELSHVHYIADPGPTADGHHFDNPVYSTFRASSPTSPSSEPLNNTRIINRLGPKITNTEREKAAAASYMSEDDQSDCVSEKGFGCTGNAFSYSSLHTKKCLEGDYGNPNIYSSVNDVLKDNNILKDNIYDEIHKRSSNSLRRPVADSDCGSYDHLEFSRPNKELRPHYQSTNTLKSIKSKGSRDNLDIDTVGQSFSEEMNETELGRDIVSNLRDRMEPPDGVRQRREGDSGISSAQSTGTVPWSSAEQAQSSGSVSWSATDQGALTHTTAEL